MLSSRSLSFCTMALCVAAPVFAAPAFAAQSAPVRDAVKLNEIQVIGTHNSYHAGLPASEAKLFLDRNPQVFQALEYRHRPLDQQLTSGVRQIELDIFADSEGGRYAHPKGPDAVTAANLPRDPQFDPEGLMSKPGFKVMHLQDFDYRSTCQPLVACLKIVRAWSHSNPKHVPIFILHETKPAHLPPQYGLTSPEHA